jgi:signal transduction histidine kinase
VNAELKGFAHALAHDLKAPIAAIRGFSNALEGALALDDRARTMHLAQRIRAGGERMGDYVDALLSLAETSQAQLSFTEVDLSAMCAEIVDGLRANDKDREVAVAIEDGMTAVGDRRLLHVLLENLIGNAWKFTSRRRDASIGICSASDASGASVFSVRDNGAGFDMAFADKLFGSFQRLHAADEFPGTGIGLANAHRIVTRHGGRIWAHSSRDVETAFSFTLGTSPVAR